MYEYNSSSAYEVISYIFINKNHYYLRFEKKSI